MWSSVTPPGGSVHGSPTTRSKHAMCTASSGHIYLMGGRAGNRLLKDLWRFDPETSLWEEVECRGSSPPSLQEHSMVAWDNKLYIFGGEVGTSSSGETPLWILHLSTLTWQRTHSSNPSLGSTRTSPLGRRAHSCVLYADAMHVFGGYQDLLGTSAELWTFDLGTEQWHLMSCPGRYSSQPCGRHSHSAVVDGEFMWIFGGMTGLKEKNDLWKWDFMTRQWTKVKTKGKGPGGLHGHSAVKSFGSMFIFGGERQGHLLHDLWSFTFATLTWRKVTTEGIVPNPTSKHASVPNPFIEPEISMTSCSNTSGQYGTINHRHSVSLHHIHHQIDSSHHGDIKEQEENEEETEVYQEGRKEMYQEGRKEESSPETPEFELDKLVLDAHASVVRRRMRPKSELVTFPSPDDTTDDLTYSEDMEWHNLKRHTVHESMSYYSLCFPSPQLSARLQAEGIRVPNPAVTDSPVIGINGTSTFGTNGTSTFGTNGTSTFGTNGTSTFGANGTSTFGTNGISTFGNGHQTTLSNNQILPPPPHPPSSMKTSLTSSGFSEATTVSSICDNDTGNKRHRLSNSSSVSFNTDSLRSSTSATSAPHEPSSSVFPSSSMSQVVPPPGPRFINRSRSFDRPILRKHQSHLRTIMTPGSIECKPWHPQINAIREVSTSPALTSKWSSYSPAKSSSGANPRQWKLCMYVFGGREEGMSFIYKRPMSIWKLYV